MPPEWVWLLKNAYKLNTVIKYYILACQVTSWKEKIEWYISVTQCKCTSIFLRSPSRGLSQTSSEVLACRNSKDTIPVSTLNKKFISIQVVIEGNIFEAFDVQVRSRDFKWKWNRLWEWRKMIVGRNQTRYYVANHTSTQSRERKHGVVVRRPGKGKILCH